MVRKYTYREINDMREIIRWSYPTGVSYNAAERDADIERRISTYMSASVDPEDMREEERRRRHEEDVREMQAYELRKSVHARKLEEK